jgi:hypothetical protein
MQLLNSVIAATSEQDSHNRHSVAPNPPLQWIQRHLLAAGTSHAARNIVTKLVKVCGFDGHKARDITYPPSAL